MMSSMMVLGGLLLSQGVGQTELTIYNAGFALVKEQREFDLAKGMQMVAVEDVAQMIEANSVGIRSLSRPGSFVVLEQNYQYDLVSPEAILAKAVGQKITFNRVLPDGSKERLVGTLMSAPLAFVSDGNGRVSGSWNGMVIQTDDGRVILNPSGEIEVASIPEGLISKPTLVWLLDAMNAGKNRVELSYLTQGMAWKSDYVLALDEAGKVGDLKGWVTLTNNSGTNFMGAKLKLLAGEVMRNQGGPGRPRGGIGGGGAEMMKADAGFMEEQFGDYHLYVLPRPADVRNKEVKQVSLLEAMGVKVGKRLLFDFAGAFGQQPPQEGKMLQKDVKPTIFVDLENSEENKMGMPLPMGSVKVFQRDKSGSLQLLGEDAIDHTPRKETLKLRVGRAFDVVADRTRKEFKWLNNTRNHASETFEVEIRNRKEEDEMVFVTHPAWGENKLVKSNFEAKKLSSGVYQWEIVMKKDSTVKLEFVIETKW